MMAMNNIADMEYAMKMIDLGNEKGILMDKIEETKNPLYKKILQRKLDRLEVKIVKAKLEHGVN